MPSEREEYPLKFSISSNLSRRFFGSDMPILERSESCTIFFTLIRDHGLTSCPDNIILLFAYIYIILSYLLCRHSIGSPKFFHKMSIFAEYIFSKHFIVRPQTFNLTVTVAIRDKVTCAFTFYWSEYAKFYSFYSHTLLQKSTSNSELFCVIRFIQSYPPKPAARPQNLIAVRQYPRRSENQ